MIVERIPRGDELRQLALQFRSLVHAVDTVDHGASNSEYRVTTQNRVVFPSGLGRGRGEVGFVFLSGSGLDVRHAPIMMSVL